jgi:hypothetical protein
MILRGADLGDSDLSAMEGLQIEPAHDDSRIQERRKSFAEETERFDADAEGLHR